jgi:hypothetical protein
VLGSPACAAQAVERGSRGPGSSVRQARPRRAPQAWERRVQAADAEARPPPDRHAPVPSTGLAPGTTGTSRDRVSGHQSHPWVPGPCGRGVGAARGPASAEACGRPQPRGERHDTSSRLLVVGRRDQATGPEAKAGPYRADPIASAPAQGRGGAVSTVAFSSGCVTAPAHPAVGVVGVAHHHGQGPRRVAPSWVGPSTGLACLAMPLPHAPWSTASTAVS